MLLPFRISIYSNNWFKFIKDFTGCQQHCTITYRKSRTKVSFTSCFDIPKENSFTSPAALSLHVFVSTIGHISCTEIKWDHKTTNPFQSGVVTTEFKMTNVTGKSTTSLTATQAWATEFGKSESEKRLMEISLCLSAGKRNSLRK